MRIWFLGVRGSSPTSGPEFLRYGGRTSCVAIATDGQRPPNLVLDAGTGLPSLTALLDGRPFRGSILLTHLHWDHVMGIPFFTAGDHDDSEVDLYLPAQDGMSGRDLLAKMMSPPSFPITPEGLRGAWTFTATPPGSIDVSGVTDVTDVVVTARPVPHKGGYTFGYRLDSPTGSLAYVPDHGPLVADGAAVVDLVDGVDVLIHDAQYLAGERSTADLFGHATVDDAISVAVTAGVGTLVLFHHAPTRSDDELDRLAATLAERTDVPLPVIVARDGQVLDLPKSPSVQCDWPR